MADSTPILSIGKVSESREQLSINKFSYYSASQVTIWFGDIMIDDIVSLQWARSQNKRPIYGYASQQFDAVAKGTVIIQGSFAINFRQTGYLTVIMDQITHIYSNLQNKSTWPEVQKVIATHLKNGTFGPQTSTEIVNIGNDPNFLSLAKSYENIVWGNGVPVEALPSLGTYAPDVVQDIVLPNGFNILVSYGNPTQNSRNSLNDYMQSTMKSINGVHLVGDSQVIQAGGQPIIEQYEFFARGTDEYVGGGI